jgi:hypothetical protein
MCAFDPKRTSSHYGIHLPELTIHAFPPNPPEMLAEFVRAQSHPHLLVRCDWAQGRLRNLEVRVDQMDPERINFQFGLRGSCPNVPYVANTVFDFLFRLNDVINLRFRPWSRS